LEHSTERKPRSRARFSLLEARRFLIDEDVRSIARRMFVTNAVDSILAYAGAVVGNYFSGNTNPYSYMATGLGLALSISLLSNFLAVFFVEEAERKVELLSLSRHMMKDLNRSLLGKAPRIVATYVAAWSALGAFSFPALSSLAFIPAIIGVLSVHLCVILSLFCVIAALFGLGLYLGKLIRKHMFAWGLRFAAIGTIPLLITFLLR